MNIILTILAVIWLVPILFSFVNMFKTRIEYNLGSYWIFPEANHFTENFDYVLKNVHLLDGMLNSFLYAMLGSILAIVFGVLAAYGVTCLNIKHPMLWFMIIYSGTIFPFQIYLIPVFKAYSGLHLYDTHIGMILFYVAICIPFIMFVLRNYFLGISKELWEAARLDGASEFQTLFRIYIPMSKAPISIVFLSQFTFCWNDLMFGLTFTKSDTVKPVMASLSLLSPQNAPVMLIACVIASLPTVIFFLFLNKNFEAGFAYSGK